MGYSTYYLLWMGLCAVTIVIGFGVWSVKSVDRGAKTQRRATLPVGREHEMDRDGQSLSLD